MATFTYTDGLGPSIDMIFSFKVLESSICYCFLLVGQINVMRDFKEAAVFHRAVATFSDLRRIQFVHPLGLALTKSATQLQSELRLRGSTH